MMKTIMVFSLLLLTTVAVVGDYFGRNDATASKPDVSNCNIVEVINDSSNNNADFLHFGPYNAWIKARSELFRFTHKKTEINVIFKNNSHQDSYTHLFRSGKISYGTGPRPVRKDEAWAKYMTFRHSPQQLKP